MQRSAAWNIEPSGKAESTLHRDLLAGDGVAEVLGHLLPVDDLAGVHPVLGIEEALQLLHRAVELVAVDPAVELGTDEAVAVLGGVRAAVLRGEREHLLGDRVHLLDVVGIGEIDEGANVQAADRAVAVEAGLDLVAVEQRRESLGVLREVGGIDGGVLDEGERSTRPGRGGHQAGRAREARTFNSGACWAAVIARIVA
jgi:hypothetical protein